MFQVYNLNTVDKGGGGGGGDDDDDNVGTLPSPRSCQRAITVHIVNTKVKFSPWCFLMHDLTKDVRNIV